jgi:hypothetical protein
MLRVLRADVLSAERQRSIVRVFDADGYLGTAFFISPTAALTCAHVVSGRSWVELRLVGAWDGGENVPLAIPPEIHPDARTFDGADLAVLKVDLPKAVAAPLCLHPGWPVESDPLTVFGYSSTKGPLEPRQYIISAYDAVGRVFSMPNVAAKGLSGGPVINEAGNVTGIAAFYVAPRNLTYLIPVARVLSFLRQASVGLPPAKSYPKSWASEG